MKLLSGNYWVYMDCNAIVMGFFVRMLSLRYWDPDMYELWCLVLNRTGGRSIFPICVAFPDPFQGIRWYNLLVENLLSLLKINIQNNRKCFQLHINCKCVMLFTIHHEKRLKINLSMTQEEKYLHALWQIRCIKPIYFWNFIEKMII